MRSSWLVGMHHGTHGCHGVSPKVIGSAVVVEDGSGAGGLFSRIGNEDITHNRGLDKECVRDD